MPNYIISPCGTSLLSGGADNEIRKLLIKYANYKDLEDIIPEHRNLLKNRIKRVKEELFKLDLNEVAKKSAELNALIKFYNGKFPSNDYHFLLCTDTYLGEQTANMICEWLKKQNNQMIVEVYRQVDLQTEDIKAFQLSLTELAEKFDETLPKYRKNNYRIVFNLTGGFKSVQGFLQVIAMFYADEIIYVFESGSNLLRIPRLPIKIDMENIRENISLFRRLDAGVLKAKQAEKLPEIFVLMVDNDVDFSPWGRVIWNRAKELLYEEKLWEEPVGYIKFSDRFKKQINDLPKHRIKEMNKRIDQLIKALKDSKYNPRSLRFHPIKVKKKRKVYT